MITTIDQQALSLPFIKAGLGGFDRIRDGWVHEKTVPYTIIAQATEGQYSIVTGMDEQVDLRPGEAFLTPPDMPLFITHHCSRRTGNMHIRYMHFNFLLYGTINLARLVSLPLAVPKVWADRFGDLAEHLVSLGQGQETYDLSTAARIKTAGYDLLGLLLDFLKEKGLEPNLRPGLFRLLPVLERIDASLGENLSVDELAAAASLSAPHFYAEFKKEMGTSPHAYMMRQRLARACDLLRVSTQSLEEISQVTGFNSPYHLGREFKKKYGIPPGQFRKRFTGQMVV